MARIVPHHRYLACSRHHRHPFGGLSISCDGVDVGIEITEIQRIEQVVNAQAEASFKAVGTCPERVELQIAGLLRRSNVS